MQEILRRRLNRPLHVRKRQVEREVVVARGRLQFEPGAAVERIYVAAGTRLGENGGGSGTLKEFLVSLGNITRRAVIDETESGGQKVAWAWDLSATKAADDRAQLRKLLAKIPASGLRLELEKRQVGIYSLEQDRPDRAGPR